jgi:hypothetical protein
MSAATSTSAPTPSAAALPKFLQAMQSAGFFAAEITRRIQSAAVTSALGTGRQQHLLQSGGSLAATSRTTSASPAAVRNPCRVYVGNVNFAMTEVEIGTLFASFGPVKSYHLVIDADNASPAATAAATAAAATVAMPAAAATTAATATNRHRGYGFVEYFSPHVADAAVAAMHNFQLAGRPLRVSYATALNDPVKSAVAAVNHAIAQNLRRAVDHTQALPGERVRGIITGQSSALLALAGCLANR